MTTATPPDAGDELPADPAVDPDDAGFPSSPELDDDNTVFTDSEPDDVSGDASD